MDAQLDSLLTSELIVSPPPEPQTQTRPRPKSPPLAFEPTSNDSLAPLVSPPQRQFNHESSASPSLSRTAMGITSPTANGGDLDLQAIVDQQANAITLLHEAFAAERQVWGLEKERLYQRIASLEKLLRIGDHYSPAKSPIHSPASGSITSPQSRANSSAARLASIAEDENVEPLSQRREGAPRSISLPGGNAAPVPQVAFINPAFLKVDEIESSPSSTARGLSPIPAHHRIMAGHTPLKAPRAPTPPPQNMLMDGMEDTPTRNNTHINNFLTMSHEEEEDEALTGPLNLPELPNSPDNSNFTLEALSKRLEQIEKDPEDAGRPMVFSEPSPGLASPAEYITAEQATEAPLAPHCTGAGDSLQSHISSNTLSPTAAATSPPAASQSEHDSRDEKVHQDFESGGIRLKRKPSTNFGAPFGSLGGYGGMRKMS